VVHVLPEADGSIPVERFAEAIDERTALVCCTTVSYRTGHRQDVAEIARIAHEHGALCLADSYQAVGAIDLDVSALDVDFVTGGTAPYLDLPGTATNDGRSARGYGEGRFRGPQLMYGEVEYRNTIMPSGLLGFVAFLNTTTVSGDVSGEKLFQSYAPAAGLGLRVLLNKHSKTNMCFDYGWGKAGSRGLYLSLQEAF